MVILVQMPKEQKSLTMVILVQMPKEQKSSVIIANCSIGTVSIYTANGVISNNDTCFLFFGIHAKLAIFIIILMSMAVWQW